MKLLLDTHALLWWGHQDRKLSEAAGLAMADGSNQVFVSAVSAMEISTKHRLGKLPEGAVLAARFELEIESLGFLGMPIALAHARRAGAFDNPHRDPFDRLLIAQALVEDMTLVSNEALFDSFQVKRLW